MAFKKSEIACFAHGGVVGSGPGSARRLWHLATNDTAAAVEGAGYFNDLAKEVQAGDLIFGSLDLDGTPVPKNYMVTSAQGATPVVVVAYPIV